MKVLLTGAFALAAASSMAQTYQFNSIVTGDTPTGGPVYADLLVEDTAPNTVKMSLSPSTLALDTQFASRLFLNIDPSVTNLNLTSYDGRVTGWTRDDNQVPFGGGKYDLQVMFDIAPPADRLFGGRTAVWTFTGTGLSAASFATTADSGLFNVLHLQGLPGGGSSHVSSQPVPEPGLLAAGLIGLLAMRRKFSRKA